MTKFNHLSMCPILSIYNLYMITYIYYIYISILRYWTHKKVSVLLCLSTFKIMKLWKILCVQVFSSTFGRMMCPVKLDVSMRFGKNSRTHDLG